MTSVFAIMLALAVGQPAALDFEFFKNEVQPIFLAKKAGFTRCIVCHSEGGRIGFLQELSDGATTWTEEESRLNFDAVSRLVAPGDTLGSRLLMHPLCSADPPAAMSASWAGGSENGPYVNRRAPV